MSHSIHCIVCFTKLQAFQGFVAINVSLTQVTLNFLTLLLFTGSLKKWNEVEEFHRSKTLQQIGIYTEVWYKKKRLAHSLSKTIHKIEETTSRMLYIVARHISEIPHMLELLTVYWDALSQHYCNVVNCIATCIWLISDIIMCYCNFDGNED